MAKESVSMLRKDMAETALRKHEMYKLLVELARASVPYVHVVIGECSWR